MAAAGRGVTIARMVRVVVRLLFAASLSLSVACDEGRVGGADDATPARADGSAPHDDARVSTGEDLVPLHDDAAASVPDGGEAPRDGGEAPDAGPTPGDCSGALLCEDFEAYPLGGPPLGPWTPSTFAGGAIAMDETRARSGRRSVRVGVSGAQAYRRSYLELSGAPIFPLPGNAMWGRMMVWLTEAPVPNVHWTNIEAEGDVPERAGVRAKYRYGGQVDKRLMANYDTMGARTDCWDGSQTPIPEGRWTCFEWRFDGAADRLEFYLDGAAISDMTVSQRGEGCIANDLGGRWLGPDFDILRLGWEHYQSSTIPIELWIDDVAVSTTRVGCP